MVTLMLSKVLNYLKKGGDANISTISRKLDIDEGTVEMLLDQLLKLGYIELISEDESIDDNCSPIKCSGCYKATSCNSFLKIRYRIVK